MKNKQAIYDTLKANNYIFDDNEFETFINHLVFYTHYKDKDINKIISQYQNINQVSSFLKKQLSYRANLHYLLSCITQIFIQTNKEQHSLFNKQTKQNAFLDKQQQATLLKIRNLIAHNIYYSIDKDSLLRQLKDILKSLIDNSFRQNNAIKDKIKSCGYSNDEVYKLYKYGVFYDLNKDENDFYKTILNNDFATSITILKEHFKTNYENLVLFEFNNNAISHIIKKQPYHALASYKNLIDNVLYIGKNMDKIRNKYAHGIYRSFDNIMLTKNNLTQISKTLIQFFKDNAYKDKYPVDDGQKFNNNILNYVFKDDNSCNNAQFYNNFRPFVCKFYANYTLDDFYKIKDEDKMMFIFQTYTYGMTDAFLNRLRRIYKHFNKNILSKCTKIQFYHLITWLHKGLYFNKKIKELLKELKEQEQEQEQEQKTRAKTPAKQIIKI